MKHTEILVIREASIDDVNGIIEVLKTIYLQDEAWARKALEKLSATEIT
jgi:N-acetylglutamate synthase-like GNAT family acetyltransferase